MVTESLLVRLEAKADKEEELPRELARRVNDGLEVALFWRARGNRTTIEVRQLLADVTLRFDVSPEHALEAFYHPFAHLPADDDTRPLGLAS